MSGQTYYIEHIECILLFSLIGFVLNWIATQKKFYELPSLSPFPHANISLLHVLLCFIIYMLSSSFLMIPIIKLLRLRGLPIFSASIWAQCLSSFSSMLLLRGLCFAIKQKDLRKIWKESSASIFKDCFLGAITWLIAFPIVGIVEQLADILVYALFGIETYEQEAVRFLKAALSTPSNLTAALLMILVAAPLIEEFLFRGILQTWLKKHIGTKAAILTASLCFALFHISASHGVGNLSLIPSLFAFSCFLGFIYERQRSLFASISLHVTFNLITTLRLLFFEIP